MKKAELEALIAELGDMEDGYLLKATVNVDRVLPALREYAATLEAVEGAKVALQDARHRLVTLEGLWATDNMGRYSEALYDGADNDKAHDLFVDQMFRIDEQEGLAIIDAALAALSAPAAPEAQ